MRRRIILASSSPRRQELIRTLGLQAEIVPSHADETVEPGTMPEQVVEELAERKARFVAERMEDREGGRDRGAVVIGSDTIVVLDGHILGKPQDGEEAGRMLQRLQGRTHEVYTGLACLTAGGNMLPAAEDEQALSDMANRSILTQPVPGGPHDADTHFGAIGRYRVRSATPDGSPAAIVGHTVSKVTFRPMSDEEIEAYVGTGEPLDKAGSYGVQGMGAVFVERIEGDYYSVMGLPLSLLYRMLLRFGISPFRTT